MNIPEILSQLANRSGNSITNTFNRINTADPSTLSPIELQLRDPRTLAQNQQRQQVEALLGFVGGVSAAPQASIKVAPGQTLANVIKEARHFSPQKDYPLIEQITDLLRKKSRSNLGEAGVMAQSIADNIGLEPTQGNVELANSFQALLEIMSRIPSRSDFNIPNLLRK